ncbi:MAG: NAD(+) diphosphatase [Spirochaetales bacterium]|nr:NAD(+) diphosphatase [Spirochaetales bacterium]
MSPESFPAFGSFQPGPLSAAKRAPEIPGFAALRRYVFYDAGQRLCRRRDGDPLLTPEEAGQLGFTPTGQELFLGLWGPHPVFALETDRELPGGFEWASLRSYFDHFAPGLPEVLARGRHLLSWLPRARFCGGCGGPLERDTEEMALFCPRCSLKFYPQITPAAITLVTRNDRILLARNRSFARNMYSLIAGFVEPGETPEQTVSREIREEAGVEVQDIRFYKGQPWPFPASLMLGFSARWKSGTPRPDGQEILDVRWFRREELPEIPGRGSISRELIDLYLEDRLDT